MGRKVHPYGFRLGVSRTWTAKWYADKEYTSLLKEDIGIRALVDRRLANASVSGVEIERGINHVTVTVHTAKPGIVIGKGGANVEVLRQQIGGLSNRKVKLEIKEIRQPELDAYLVATNISQQLSRRIASTTRRALRVDPRTYLAVAETRISCLLGYGGPVGAPAVPAVGAGRGELTEAVADHVLGHVDRDVLLAVVDGDRVADERREDHRRARPGLHDLLLVAPVHLLDPPLEAKLDERALLDRTGHVFLPPRYDLRWRERTMSRPVVFARRVR